MSSIQVAARIAPLKLTTLHLGVEEGVTVEEIVERVFATGYFRRELLPVLSVTIDEKLVPLDHWRMVRPAAGARVALIPMFQDGGGKTGTVIGALALVAATAATGGAFGPAGLAIAGGYFAAGSTSAALLGGLVGLAGSAALTLFTPKPVTSKGGGGNPGQLPAAGFSGNRLAPYDQIPTVIGRIRAAPAFLTDSWVRMNGTKEAVRGVVGLAGHIEWSEIRVNGMLHTDAEGVQIETVNGDGQSTVNWPSFVVAEARTKELGFTDRIGVELKKFDMDRDGHNSSPSYSTLEDIGNPDTCIPKFYSFITKDSPQIICINLKFPGGLYESDATGSTREMRLHIRMRLIGETAWRNLPELQIREQVNPFNFVVYISWEPIFDDNEGTAATTSYHGNLGNGDGPAAWTSDPYFDQSSDIADHCIHRSEMSDHDFSTALTEHFINHVGVFLGESDAPFVKGRYEIQIKRSLTSSQVDGQWVLTDGARRDPFNHSTIDGAANRISPRQKEMSDTCILDSVTYLWDEDALQAPNTAAIAYEFRNTQVDHLTAIAESWTVVPTANGWDGYGPTRNPAALFRHVLTNPVLNKAPLDLTLIDDARLIEWYDFCEESGLTCGAMIEGGSVEDALLICCRAGQALLARSGRSWRVAIDKDRSSESPTVVFSPRNTRNLVVERTFEELPHAIRATFLDEENDYTQTEIFVYDDPYNANTATLVRAVDYVGVVNRQRVERLAQLDLRKARLRRNSYSLETGPMSLAIDKGDLVGLASDVLDGFWGWAYIVGKTVIDGNIAGIEIDTAISIPTDVAEADAGDLWDIPSSGEVAAAPFVAITLSDGSAVLEKQVTDRGMTRHLTFATPFTDTALVTANCHVSIGAGAGATYRRCIVEDIRPGRDFTAQVILRDEAPAIFAP